MGSSSLPENLLEPFGGLLDSVAWACVLFAAIVPEYHPAHCPTILRLMSHPQLREPAKLTFGVYCLHWPVVFDFIRYMPRSWLPSNVYLLFFLPFLAITLISFGLAWLAHRYIEIPSVRWAAVSAARHRQRKRGKVLEYTCGTHSEFKRVLIEQHGNHGISVRLMMANHQLLRRIQT